MCLPITNAPMFDHRAALVYQSAITNQWSPITGHQSGQSPVTDHRSLMTGAPIRPEHRSPASGCDQYASVSSSTIRGHQFHRSMLGSFFFLTQSCLNRNLEILRENHHQSSSTIIHRSPIIVNHHQSSSIIINEPMNQ